MFDEHRTDYRRHTGGVKSAEHPDVGDLTLTGVLAALADPIRMGLVQSLADGREKAWSELRAPVAKSTLSHHLKVLRSAGVTRTRQEGTRCFVRLRRDDLDERFPGVLSSVLAATEPPAMPPPPARRAAG